MKKVFAQLIPRAVRTSGGQVEIPADLSDETQIRVQIRVHAVSGTTPALTVSLQDTLEGTWWSAVVSQSAISTVTTVAIGAGSSVPFGPRCRVSWSMTGTSPSFDFEVSVFTR